MQQLEWDHGSLWLVRGSMVLRYRPSACIQSGKKGEKERYEREKRRVVGLVACGEVQQQWEEHSKELSRDLP